MKTSEIKATWSKLIGAILLCAFIFSSVPVSAQNTSSPETQNFSIYINGTIYQGGYFTAGQDIYVRAKSLKKALNLSNSYSFPPQVEWEHSGKTYVSLEGAAKILSADLEVNWNKKIVRFNYSSPNSASVTPGQTQVNNYYNYYGTPLYPYGFYPYYYSPFPLFGLYYSDCWDWEWGCGFFDNFAFVGPILEEPVVINIISSSPPMPLPVVNHLTPFPYFPRPPFGPVAHYRNPALPPPIDHRIWIHSPGFTPNPVFHPGSKAGLIYHPSGSSHTFIYHPAPSAPAFRPSAPAFRPSAPAFRPSAPAFRPSAPPPPSGHRR